MANGLRIQIKEILQSNGWISNVEIAHQIKKPVAKVDKVLRDFKEKGCVDARPSE